MKTSQAIQWLAKQLTHELAVGTTGYTCRDLQAAGDRKENFYMIGSMGLAASLGLGVALCRPNKKVVVFDGDGAALMALGGLATIASMKPKNLIHVVFDNEAFVSTGKQPTCSAQVDLSRVAQACGYAWVARVSSSEELERAWFQVRTQQGPIFLLVKCEPDTGEPAPRVTTGPEELTRRFMEAVNA